MAHRVPDDVRGLWTPRAVPNGRRLYDHGGAVPAGPPQVVALPYAPWAMWVIEGQVPWWFGNAYWAFAVGQGLTLRQMRHEARNLIGPFSWCEHQSTPWTRMSREGWHRYWQELVWLKGAHGGIPILRSLHRWYAFWQWDAPWLVPEMPLPQTATTQRRWIQEMEATPPVWTRRTSPHPRE